jgi:hypothetical protein
VELRRGCMRELGGERGFWGPIPVDEMGAFFD